MGLEVRFAGTEDTDQVLSLFGKYLSPDNDALHSQEFFCPFGVKAAIKRNQMIVACNKNIVVAAARFYKRKNEEKISLYQFAVDTNYRGEKLSLKMLDLIRDNDIIVLCPKTSDFNDYYRKTGWGLSKKDNEHNHWVLPAKQTT